MKRIKLIKTSVTNSVITEQQPAFELDYRKEFLRIVEIFPEGCTVSQMAQAIRVAEKLQSTPSGDDLILEDAEMDYLRDKMKVAKFGFAAPELVKMVEALEQAESILAPHLKSDKAGA